MLRLSFCVLILCATFPELVAKNVSAKFKYSVNQSDSSVTITNQSSKNADSYILNYGDGIIVTDNEQKDYQHKYSEIGVYTVCLIVTSGSDTDTSCEQVVIVSAIACSADFNYSISGLAVTLVNRSKVDLKKIVWTLGDGTKKTNVDSFLYIYSSPGIYKINLSIKNSKIDCESEISKTVVIQGDTNNCIASFSYSFLSESKVKFENSSIGDYDKLLWKFGNGDFSEVPSPEYEFVYPGIYNVKLVVKSKTNKVKTSYTELIVIEEDKIDLLPDFEAITYPDSLAASFDNYSIGTDIKQYTWAFGDGSISKGNKAYHVYNKPGDYNVCLTITANSGSSASSCQQITVGREFSLTPEFTYLLNNDLEANFLPYFNVLPDSTLWSFGDGAFSIENQPEHVFPKNDIYLVSLKSKYSRQNAERMHILNLTNDPTKLICMFKPEKDANVLKADSKKVRYRGSLAGDVSRIKFEWDFGDGSTDSLNLETDHTYAEDGYYTACLNVYNELSGDYDKYCEQVVIGEPSKIEVRQNSSLIDMYINEQNGFTNIIVTDNKALRSSINVCDISGRIIDEVFIGAMNAGLNKLIIETPKQKGLYIIHYQSSNGSMCKKFIVN